MAEAELERGLAPDISTDKVFVFRSLADWTLLTMERHERYDDHGRPVSGRAVLSAERFAALGDLAAHVERVYRSGAWLEIVDAGHENDSDLYAAWVPERMRRDLDRSSIHSRDLAHAAGYFDPNQLGAPGRALADWKNHALGALAAHLDDLGWQVFLDPDKVTDSADPGGTLSERTEIVGALRARRYGYEAAILVRVDDCGEIYARLAEPGDIAGPALRLLGDEELEEG